MSEPSTGQRRVALVVGTDPAGAAAVASTLAALGLGEPSRRWVSDLHTELLDRAHVEGSDARPSAWFEAGKITANGIPRARVTEWLAPQFVDAEGEPLAELVVSDAGLPWLLGLWGAAALRCDAEPAHVVVLQPATEVATDLSGVAGWLNLALHTERGTRDMARAFVRYADVLADWTIPFVALGAALPLRAVQEATANQMRQAHTVVADTPRPTSSSWDDLGAPAAIRELAEETWAALAPLPEDDTAERRATLDQLRAAYVAAYDEAEALTRSSVRAARRAGVSAAEQPAGGGPDQGGVRRGLRKALGRDR